MLSLESNQFRSNRGCSVVRFNTEVLRSFVDLGLSYGVLVGAKEEDFSLITMVRRFVDKRNYLVHFLFILVDFLHLHVSDLAPIFPLFSRVDGIQLYRNSDDSEQFGELT